MKTRISVVLLVVWSALCVPSWVVEGTPVGLPQGAPDLVVKEIKFEQESSKIRVRVMNEGRGASKNCHLALASQAPADSSLATKQRVWTIEIPALEAGKGFSNVIDISPLDQANGPWRATVDRSNTVKESNENNNALTYPMGNPGPMPPRRLPDLTIARFSLAEPSTGHVGILVANTSLADAGPSTLRLIVWEPGKFEQKEAKTVFVKVPAVARNQKVRVNAVAGIPIINTKFSLYVDISNEVAESNENNNRGEGEAGNYKP
jgi:CARDB protein